MDIDLRITVLESFKVLQQALADLKTSILADSHLLTWIDNPPGVTPWEVRLFAATQIQQCEYLTDQDPKETLLCVGYLGASARTIAAVQAVNDAKQRFKTDMLALRAAKISLKDTWLTENFEGLLLERSPELREAMRKMGLARLHLKQCYRPIPLLGKVPTKIRFTWAHTRAILRVSVEQAIALLRKRGQDYGIEQQILQCGHLQPSEPLAIIQELAPHLRANLIFGSKETGIERRMIKAPLPIFFPADERTVPPNCKPPKEKTGKDSTREIRSDTKINPEVFLPAIRAHRYFRAPEETHTKPAYTPTEKAE